MHQIRVVVQTANGTRLPSLKPVGFDLRTYVQEAGYNNRADLSDAALLEHLVADARKRRQ